MRGLGAVFRKLSSMIQESPGGCSSEGFRQPSKSLAVKQEFESGLFLDRSERVIGGHGGQAGGRRSCQKIPAIHRHFSLSSRHPGRTHYISFARITNFVNQNLRAS